MGSRHEWTEPVQATPPRVPRIGRVLDLFGLALFAGGVAVCVRAWSGFRSVEAFQPGPDDPLWSALRMADGYWRLQRVGVGLMIGGVAVFALAWWVARRRSRVRA